MCLTKSSHLSPPFAHLTNESQGRLVATTWQWVKTEKIHSGRFLFFSSAFSFPPPTSFTAVLTELTIKTLYLQVANLALTQL